MSPRFVDVTEGTDAHGAVMSALHQALRDTAATRAADDSGRGGFDIVTVDVHVSFFGAATGRLAVQAQVTGGGRSVCFCQARLVDTQGALVAQAMGTFRAVARG